MSQKYILTTVESLDGNLFKTRLLSAEINSVFVCFVPLMHLVLNTNNNYIISSDALVADGFGFDQTF